MRATRLASLVFVALIARATAATSEVDSLMREALAAEAQLNTPRALELLLAADELQSNSPPILRKIARQYSDLAVDLPEPAKKKASIEQALRFATRAVSLEPANAENVLSLAVCYGKLAQYGSTREKVAYSRQVRESALRALHLSPDYAWAHHVMGRWHHEVSALSSTVRFLVRVFYRGLPEASTVDAVRHLTRAVELEPGQLQHWLELGFAHLANGNPTAARASFAVGLDMPVREKHDAAAKDRARAVSRNR